MDDQRRHLSKTLVWTRTNIITAVLAVFIVISLLLHVFTLLAWYGVRRVMIEQLETSAQQLAEVRQQSVPYTFPIDQSIPVNTTITISDTVIVPINITVPIRETIQLPVRTPLGTYTFDVPLDFTVPVSDTVEVPINKQIPIVTDIPIEMDIPVDIKLNEPPISDVLKQFEDALLELRRGL